MKRTTFLKSLAGLAVLPLMSFKDIFKSKEDGAIEALGKIELIGLEPVWRIGGDEQFEIKYPKEFGMSWCIKNSNNNLCWMCGSCSPVVRNGEWFRQISMETYDITISLLKDGNWYERTWARAIIVLPPVFDSIDYNKWRYTSGGQYAKELL